MRPAFGSTAGAAAFALLVGSLLAGPVAASRAGCLRREDVYASVPVKHGPFAWIQQQIFREKGDVDIAFLGSSHLWTAIHTPALQRDLSAHLGRESEVVTLGWPWGGFDALYFVARDLLEHRRVRVLVVHDEGQGDGPHLMSSRWYEFGEPGESLDGLPLKYAAGLYASATLGLPRHLLSLAREDRLEDPAVARGDFWNTYYDAPNVATVRGDLRARITLGELGVSHDFVRFVPPTPASPDGVRVSSAVGHERASGAPGAPGALGALGHGALPCRGEPLSPYARHFVDKLGRLAREKGTELVFLHTPHLDERGKPGVEEDHCWTELLGAPSWMVGLSTDALLSGLSTEEARRLFFDDDHLNENGQDLFTPLVTPALIAIHDSASLR